VRSAPGGGPGGSTGRAISGTLAGQGGFAARGISTREGVSDLLICHPVGKAEQYDWPLQPSIYDIRLAYPANTRSTALKHLPIIYVPDVAASLVFFTRAFGLARRFLHESGTYGELETGATTLAFAAHELGETHFPGGHVAAHSSAQPLGMEIALVTADVAAAHRRAVAAGASELAAPTAKPWGQIVSYVRCPDGTLVELCTSMVA
jgi:lactoylglutathione lyase